MSVGCTYLPDFLSPDDDSFGVLETDLEGVSGEFTTVTSSGGLQEVVGGRKRKRLKMCMVEDGIGGSEDGQQNVLHISVERNRRKQMNEHLNVLRSLMPCFYVKRGDQASIIEGVVDYITELQQILQSLEAKKQRKVYSEIVLRPMLDSIPRKPPFSPMPNMPISPRTPQPEISYRPMPAPFISPSLDTSPVNSFDNADNTNELMANSKSDVAEVEVKFIGGNLLLKTCSNRILGKATKIIAVLENLSLEVLQAKISVVDETMVNSFIIKIGVECQLSAEELAQHIQQTFC